MTDSNDLEKKIVELNNTTNTKDLGVKQESFAPGFRSILQAEIKLFGLPQTNEQLQSIAENLSNELKQAKINLRYILDILKSLPTEQRSKVAAIFLQMYNADLLSTIRDLMGNESEYELLLQELFSKNIGDINVARELRPKRRKTFTSEKFTNSQDKLLEDLAKRRNRPLRRRRRLSDRAKLYAKIKSQKS